MSVETQFRINDNESYPPLQTSPGYGLSSDGFQPNKSLSEKFAESNFQPIKPLNSSAAPTQRESEQLDETVTTTTPPRERLNSGTQDSSDLPPSGDPRKQASPSYSDCYTSDSSCAATPMKWEPTSPQEPTTPGGNPFNSLGHFSFHSPDKELEAAFVPRKDHNGMDLYFCHLCSFTGTSKEVFSAHMNTHFEHSCPHCDYTSRTEGRLKRHIKDFHSTSPPDNYSGNKTAKAMPGRPKVYRCKQCEFVATEKLDFWAHARTHIKEDKLLQCPKCPFVTEYKHHLEYHLRNHFGSKPFKCSKCNYACVNKSMLNSHMKSHTNVYQYRCADCTYATKYCHSLKLHLRKYNHKPATVLNSDGSLPQGLDAEAAGLSLMMKRGPPRGPRGPRKDKLEAYLGQLMSMPPLGPRPGMNGLISPYWPLLGQFPGGFHPPPPLIPVSAPGGAAGGMLNALPQQKLQGPGVSGGMCSQDQLTLKCTFCCFSTIDKEELTGHMLKVHASENQDLFSAFGISSDSLLEEQKQRAQRAEREQGDHPTDFSKKPANTRPPSHPNEALSMTDSLHIRTDTSDEVTKSSPRSWPPASSETLEKENMNSCKSMPELFYLNEMKMSAMSSEVNSNGDTSDILRQMTLKFGGSVSSAVKENKECPLDLTKPKMMTAASYYVSAKRTYEHMESSHFAQESGAVVESSSISNAPSPSPRKRSRKGKAYKLDTISWKLQGMTSEHDSGVQEDAASTGSHDDVDDGAENSDHYSEKETEFSEFTPRNRGDLNTSEEKDDFADSKITDTSTPKRANGSNGSSFGGRDLEQIHNSLKILNENDAERKDGLHGEDRCPSPVSDLRRCSMGSNMGIPDLPVLGRTGHRSPSDFKEQNKSMYGSRSSATPAAVRKGAEIAWKILHPQQQGPGMLYQNGSTAQGFNPGELHTSVAPAGNFSNMCTRLPHSQKLPAKVNGMNGTVHATPMGRKSGRQGSEKYECSYCEIAFRDCVMYTMHMGYHGYQDPYKCNMCGHQSRDKVDFFLHIARAAHA